MQLRRVFALAGLVVAGPACAGELLKPFEAKQFVAGRVFSYTCFEGTTGAGRINADGSVVGTVRIRGEGPVRHVVLPEGTVKVSEAGVCASMRGVPIQPCFDVQKNNAYSFRGSIAGAAFAYCEFTRHHPKLRVASQTDEAARDKTVERPRPLAPPRLSARPSTETASTSGPEQKLRLRSSTAE
jgi:hypothetical protein